MLVINRIYKFSFFFLLAIVVLDNECYSQKTSYAGINFTVENSSGNFRPGIGGVFEMQLSKHSGFETGVYYRNYIQSFYLTVTGPATSNTYFYTVSERHISIPFQYKFYSRILNLSIGPSFDFYLGWKQKNKTSLIVVNEYSIDPNFFIGAIAKVSKRINLNSRFLLEPELRFNPIFTSERSYVGFGIAGKYKIGRKFH